MKIFDKYEHLTSDYYYVETSIKGQGAPDYFDETFASGCNCLSDSCSFPGCSCLRSGDNYMMNKNCRVLMPDFLKNDHAPVTECHEYCSCFTSCNNISATAPDQDFVLTSKYVCLNRYVQFGPHQALQIFHAGIKGYGVRSSMSLIGGQFICEYAGEIISDKEGIRRLKENHNLKKMNYVFIIMEYFGNKKQSHSVDPSTFGNIGRYINHSCNPNAAAIPVRVSKLLPLICIFAIRDIAIDEEITFDYAVGEETLSSAATKCLCGSSNCRGYLPSQ